jgi:hypothetical protein
VSERPGGRDRRAVLVLGESGGLGVALMRRLEHGDVAAEAADTLALALEEMTYGGEARRLG